MTPTSSSHSPGRSRGCLTRNDANYSCAQVVGLDGVGEGTATAEAIAVAQRVRVLKHELQVALLAVATADDADAAATPASHADVSWVHDQVVDRPYMAQVVSHWFGQARRLSTAEVGALRHLDRLIAQIEGLAPTGQGENARFLNAVQSRMFDVEKLP